MVGTNKSDAIIANNLGTELNIHLRDNDCIVVTSDIKVLLEEANCYYYPHVVVTYDKRDLSSNEDFIRYPSLII